MPGECYPAFHMSLAVLCVLVCSASCSGRLFSVCECVATNTNVHFACRGCFTETVYAPLPLCAGYTPAVLSSTSLASLSLSQRQCKGGCSPEHTHTHTLYYILRTSRILSHNYIIAFRSQRVFIQNSAFISAVTPEMIMQRWASDCEW